MNDFEKWNALSESEREEIIKESNKVVNDVLTEFARILLHDGDVDPFDRFGGCLRTAVRWALHKSYMKNGPARGR